jgi:hypothetical protein
MTNLLAHRPEWALLESIKRLERYHEETRKKADYCLFEQYERIDFPLQFAFRVPFHAAAPAVAMQLARSAQVISTALETHNPNYEKHLLLLFPKDGNGTGAVVVVWVRAGVEATTIVNADVYWPRNPALPAPFSSRGYKDDPAILDALVGVFGMVVERVVGTVQVELAQPFEAIAIKPPPPRYTRGDDWPAIFAWVDFFPWGQ